MANHTKPTKEELDAKLEAEIAEAEKLKDEPVETSEEIVEPEEEVTPEEEPKKEEDEPVVEPKEEEPEEDEPDLKKKLSASARENQKIYASRRVINTAIAEASQIPEPTEEELAKEYPDWDVMSETERTFAKETVVNRNFRAKIAEAQVKATNIDKWNESVESFADDPETLVKHPELEGKTEEFKDFAMEETNNSVPFSLLVSAFLYQKSSGKTEKKGAMFEEGTGGANDKPEINTGKLSLEESRKLRENDYPKWKEMLKAGKIDTEV
jgi:hypothetical protein